MKGEALTALAIMNRPCQEYESDWRTAGDPRPNENGFAIVVVLVVVSLMALVAIVLQKSVAVDVRSASYLAKHARAEALADGLTRLAIRHLVVNTPGNGRSGPFRLDGIPLTCRAGASLATIAFTSTDGQINLNLASEALLKRALAGVGVSDGDAARLAQNVIDFRSSGDRSIDGGSKLGIYREAGLNHGPKNGPFESVGELEQVVGMTLPLLERLQPLVTVHSRFGVINPSVVSMPVAVALSGGSASEPLDILQARLNLPSEFTYIPKTRGTISTNSDTYLIRVAVSMGTAARFTRAAVVEKAPATQSGAVIMDWSELDPDRYGVDLAASDTPACIGGLLSLEPS